MKQSRSAFLLLGLVAAACIGDEIAVGDRDSGQKKSFPVPESYQRCGTEADCVVVVSDCAGCCQYETLHAEHELAYEQARAAACTDNDGLACECQRLEKRPRCIEHRCELVAAEVSCDDRRDNDSDGAADCEDPDCRQEESCEERWVEPPRLAEVDGLVAVPEEYQECEEEADCVTVVSDCNGCCRHEGIRAEFQSFYEEGREAACTDFSGPICDCEPPEESLRCISQHCELVPKEVSCADDRDNDFDGAMDCQDPDCQDEQRCQLQVEEETGLVSVPEEYQACEEAADCVRVVSDCYGCCRHEGIRAEFESIYEDGRNAACTDYVGPVCDCEPPEESLRCISQRCELVPQEVSCADDRDNDFDGATDCQDPDCQDEQRCQLQVEEETGLVSVPEEYQACEEAVDCVRVVSDCNGCCRYEGIRAEFQSIYEDGRNAACTDYVGPVCDCEPPEESLRCISERCELVPEEVSCADDRDNDYDGAADCEDPDCAGDDRCAT